MNKKLLTLILLILPFIVLVGASVTFAVIHVTTTVGVSEPFSDTSFTHYYGFSTAYYTPKCFTDTVVNHAGVSLNVSVEWIEVPGSNPYGLVYTTNMPFNQTINPGSNSVTSCVQCVLGGCGSISQGVTGVSNITRI